MAWGGGGEGKRTLFLLRHVSLVREQSLSQKPQKTSSGPGQNWSTGHVCLQEDRVSLFYTDHNAHNRLGFLAGAPAPREVLEIEKGHFWSSQKKKKRGDTGMWNWISLRMLNVLKCIEPFYTQNKVCLTQNTKSSAIKKYWAHTNDHSPPRLKVSWLKHNLGAKSKKENTAPSRGALVPRWGSGGRCLIVLAHWVLFRKYCYLQRMESKTRKSTPRAAFIFPNEEISP